jgi:ABC-type branched-subunit amino acid transport system ATPase component/ABC-type branched-subunit amino acid transport system permease subunit
MLSQDQLIASTVLPAAQTQRKTRIVSRALLVAGLMLLAMFPLLPTPQFWITQANYIGMYALVAIGLVLLTGVGGMTSFGQAAFVGLGAYTTAYLTTTYGMSPWLTLVIGLVITGGSALLLGWLTLRMSGHYLPLATIAWGISLFLLFGKVSWLGKYDGIADVPGLRLFSIDLGSQRSMFYLIWAVVVIATWLVVNLLDSRTGRAIRALKGGKIMAEAMGVNTGHYKILIFLVAALLACLSGWLFAHYQRTINPSPFSINMGISYLFMAVVGGTGHVGGAILGAGIVKLLEDQLQVLLPKIFGSAGSYETIVFGLILVLLLKYARDGLWPWLLSGFRQVFPEPARPLIEAGPSSLSRRTQSKPGMPLLEVKGVTKRFGGLVAVNSISFGVKTGDIVGLIGPNGAGKSTTFGLITGLLPPSEGVVLFNKKNIAGMSSRAISQCGIARSFQHVQLLPTMTVLENVALGAHQRANSGFLGGAVRSALRLDRAEEVALFNEAAHALDQVGLKQLMHEKAGNLALGQQRLLEIARALCCDPVLLLLDEPAAGLRHLEKQALAKVLRQLKAQGMSILLVEHDMQFVMSLTDHIVVMEFGIKIAEGTPDVIQTNPAVIEAYLGGVE